MFLKKKRNWTIKVRGFANSRKQTDKTPREDASSPPFIVKLLMLSSVMVAKKGRNVAVVDIPGALMQADVDDVVHMKLEGTTKKCVMFIVDCHDSRLNRGFPLPVQASVGLRRAWDCHYLSPYPLEPMYRLRI